jgi:hypothetical protein
MSRAPATEAVSASAARERTLHVDGVAEERIARNDDVFRSANQKIRAAADEHHVDGHVPFICECADPACTRVIPLDPSEYAEVRSSPRWFLSAPDHDVEADAARLVARRERFLIVEKVGRAGAVAESLAESG